MSVSTFNLPRPLLQPIKYCLSLKVPVSVPYKCHYPSLWKKWLRWTFTWWYLNSFDSCDFVSETISPSSSAASSCNRKTTTFITYINIQFFWLYSKHCNGLSMSESLTHLCRDISMSDLSPELDNLFYFWCNNVPDYKEDIVYSCKTKTGPLLECTCHVKWDVLVYKEDTVSSS